MSACPDISATSLPYPESQLAGADVFPAARHLVNVLQWIDPTYWKDIRERKSDQLASDAKADIRDQIQEAISDLASVLGAPADGFSPTAPALYFPAGVYPAANLIWDPRVPLVGEHVKSTHLQYFEGGQLDSLPGWASALPIQTEAVIHIVQSDAFETDTLGGISGMRISGARAWTVGDGSAPFVRHLVHARARVVGTLVFQDVYLAVSTHDALRFDEGVTDVILDRFWVEKAGRYGISIVGPALRGDTWSFLLSRFTIVAARPVRRTYTAGSSLELTPTESIPYNPIDQYLDHIVLQQFGAQPYLADNPGVAALVDAKLPAPKDIGAFVEKFDYWGAGLLEVVRGDGGRLLVTDGRVEAWTLLLAPRSIEHAPFSITSEIAASLSPPALVLLDDPRGADTSVDMERVFGYAEEQNGLVIVRASTDSPRIATSEVQISRASAHLFHDWPSSRPTLGGVTTVISDFDQPAFENGYADPGALERVARLSQQGRRQEGRAGESLSTWSGRFRAGDFIVNTRFTATAPFGWVATAPDANASGFWRSTADDVLVVEPIVGQASVDGTTETATSWRIARPSKLSRFVPGDRVSVFGLCGIAPLADTRVLRVDPLAARVWLYGGDVPSGLPIATLRWRPPIALPIAP